MSNPFDQFDTPSRSAANPFDQFDAPQVGAGQAFTRGMRQGSTFNFGDEMAAAAAASPIPGNNGSTINAIDVIAGLGRLAAEKVAPGLFGTSGGEAYAKAIDRERALGAAAETQHPWSSAAGQIAGGLGLGLGAAGAGATLMRSGMTLPAMIRAGAAEGALYGGAYGLGGGEGSVADRAKNAVSGAEIGAAFGGATPLLGRAAGAVINRIPGRSTAEKALSDATAGIDPRFINEAHDLMQRAHQDGVSLTFTEALGHVTNGASRALDNLTRVVQDSPGGAQIMGPVYGRRAAEVEAAAKRQFDTIAPAPATPSSIGADANALARRAVMETPAGQALSEAEWRSGPRMTQEQAGQVIQPELRSVYDRREGMRNALAEGDYAAAREAPATVPVNEGLRTVEGYATALDRPGINITINPAERKAAADKWLQDNSQFVRTDIIGGPATQFVQVDPSPVLRRIDEALATAKGAPREGLKAARRALMNADGTMDTSVAGLHSAREAITDLITQAKQAGATQTARHLMGTVDAIDESLASVPAYGQAKTFFEAASKPLRPFDESSGPGKVIARDVYNREYTLPPEKVMDVLSSPSAARDFVQVATPAARDAMERALTTRMLEKAGGGTGIDISGDGIRAAMRSNEDLLRQFPAVRTRLNDIASSRDGLRTIEASPIGRIAQRDVTTRQAIDALFPKNPVAGSVAETRQAIKALYDRSPDLARQLVRVHMDTVFEQAARDLQSGANQFGGANFVSALMGNKAQAENLAAAIDVIGGPDMLRGVDRFMNIIAATGRAPKMGSPTGVNIQQREALSGNGKIRETAIQAASGFVRLPARIQKAYEAWSLGRNTEQIARLLTDPKAIRLIKMLGEAPQGSAKAASIASNLGAIAAGTSMVPTER